MCFSLRVIFVRWLFNNAVNNGSLLLSVVKFNVSSCLASRSTRFCGLLNRFILGQALVFIQAAWGLFPAVPDRVSLQVFSFRHYIIPGAYPHRVGRGVVVKG
jgi:hypothetical protein